MDIYHGMSSGTTSGSDHTVSSSGSGSWTSQSPIRRRRIPSPSPNAFLGPAFNACASSPKSPAAHLDLDPALLRYTRSRLADQSDSPMSRMKLLPHQLLHLRSPRGGVSPLSSIGNLVAGASSVYKTPVKMEVEEDVLVMDGVLVGENSGSGRARVLGELGSSGSSSGSGGIGNLYKTEICRLWVETGVCRYGSKCQFAHGKEELRGTRPVKPKSEGAKHPQATTGSKGRYIPPPVAAAMALATKAATTTNPIPPLELPSLVWPPSEEEEAFINRVLYGPSQKHRLPAFLEICLS